METQRSRARLGVAIIVFFAMIVLGALLWTLLNEPLTSVLDYGTAYSDSSTTDKYLGFLESIWGYALFIVLFISGMYVVGRGVIEGRVG